MRKARILLLSVLISVSFSGISAQTKETVGDVLYAVSLRKDIGQSLFSVKAYSEFTLHYRPLSMGYNYSLAGVRYAPLEWLSGYLGFGYTEEDGPRRVLGQMSLFQTLDKPNWRIWFREMYIHYYDPDDCAHSDLLRLRANAMYKFQNSIFSPLAAAEVYLWDRWKRTSVYVGCNLRISEIVGINVYYMASFLDRKNMHHLVLSTSVSLR